MTDLNRDCQCLSVDLSKLAGSEHLFSTAPYFLTSEQVQQMREVVRTITALAQTPQWIEAALADAPAIARHVVPQQGVFFGYDFHLSADGPQLIEINTNAGGAFLNALPSTTACCDEVEVLRHDAEAAIIDMFRREARGELRRIAIVDERPREQFLYPEFELAVAMFARHGIEAAILDPSELVPTNFDLIYNRSTDFYFEHTPVLRQAYLDNSVVITPHPRAHALLARKSALVALSERLPHAVPKTIRVRPEDAEQLWRDRKGLFFKPLEGFGSKAVYRGDKLTKGVFATILTGGYVAQALVPPSERVLMIDGERRPLKADIRAYAYAGEVFLFAARLYQGQTTNFRTAGGGFAPIVLHGGSGV